MEISDALLLRIKTALNCADADLQGALDREDLSGDDAESAEKTREDIAAVLTELEEA